MKGVKISIDPDPVAANNDVTVAVSAPGGCDPLDLLMRIVSARDSDIIKIGPRGLDAYGTPRQGEPGTYDCRIRTTGFDPGEYVVDVSPMGSFEPSDTASKKFTVSRQKAAAASTDAHNTGVLPMGLGIGLGWP